MATSDSILGTSGKESIPLEYQSEQQRIARKRAMAQVMMQRSMGGVPAPQMFGRHMARTGVLPHLTKALEGYLGRKGMEGADTDQESLMTRMSAARASDIEGAQAASVGSQGQNFRIPANEMDWEESQGLTGAMASDPRRGIAKLMASGFGDVQNMGKLQNETFNKTQQQIADLIKEYDPQGAAGRLASGNISSEVPGYRDIPVRTTTDAFGNQMVITTDPVTNKQTTTYAPRPPVTNNNINTGQVLENKVNEVAAGNFNYGGKGFEKGEDALKSLTINSEILNTLEKNPTMGAGAQGIQFLAKWAKTLGVNIGPNVTNSEMIAMQLGDRVFNKLGGLGAQVSDADRNFLLSTQGNELNDPEAVRRIVLIETKYLMRLLNRTNQQAESVASRLPAGTALPQHRFNFHGSKRDMDDLDNLFAEKGFAVPAGKPAANPTLPPGVTEVPKSQTAREQRRARQ